MTFDLCLLRVMQPPCCTPCGRRRATWRRTSSSTSARWTPSWRDTQCRWGLQETLRTHKNPDPARCSIYLVFGKPLDVHEETHLKQGYTSKWTLRLHSQLTLQPLSHLNLSDFKTVPLSVSWYLLQTQRSYCKRFCAKGYIWLCSQPGEHEAVCQTRALGKPFDRI